jgi:Short C-terminal domain
MLRRRPVMRTMARTAVVVGTASAVAGTVHHHQEQKYAAQDQAAYDEQQAQAQPQQFVAAPAPAPAGGMGPDQIAELKQLAELKDQGILTEEEFAAQKAKLLG